MLTGQQRADWAEKGYIIVEGLLGPLEISHITQTLDRQVSKIAPELSNAGATLHQRLLALRQDRKSFSRLYDTMQSNAALQGMMLTERILSMAGELLGDPWETLSVSGIGLRLDPPKDSRNALGWHQERSYYDQNDDGLNGLVIWVALQDVDDINGGVLVKPGSHKEGFVEAASSGKIDTLVSEQFIVPEEVLTRYPDLQVKIPAGSAVLFNFNVFHASGPNVSDRIRMTIQARIHRALADDFRPGRYQWVAS